MFLVSVLNIGDIMGIMMRSFAKDSYSLLSLYVTNRTLRKEVLKFIRTDKTALSFIKNAVYTGHYAAWVFLLRDVGHLVKNHGLSDAALLAQNRGLHGFVCAYVRYGGFDFCDKLFLSAARWGNDHRPLRAMLRDGYAQRMSMKERTRFLHRLVRYHPPIDRFMLLENAGFDLAVESLPDMIGDHCAGNSLLRTLVKYGATSNTDDRFDSRLVQLAVYFVEEKGMDPAQLGPKGEESVFELAATMGLWNLVEAMILAGGDYEKVRDVIEGKLCLEYDSDTAMYDGMMAVGREESIRLDP